MIVYFDGHCSLCNGFVDFLIRRDRRHRLMYAPMQGETARARLPAALVNDIATMAVFDGTEVAIESTAALRAIGELGGRYSVVSGMLLRIPRRWRDALYRAIASHRYRLFGRRPSCRLPSPDERSRFLP